MKLFKTLAVIFLISPFGLTAQPAQPEVAPAALVDPITLCEYRYFYYPNLEAYYDSRTGRYWILQNGQWTTATEIPSGFRGYSLFNKMNVVIDDYDEDNITQFLQDHKKRFPVRFNARHREVAAAPKHIP